MKDKDPKVVPIGSAKSKHANHGCDAPDCAGPFADVAAEQLLWVRQRKATRINDLASALLVNAVRHSGIPKRPTASNADLDRRRELTGECFDLAKIFAESLEEES